MGGETGLTFGNFDVKIKLVRHIKSSERISDLPADKLAMNILRICGIHRDAELVIISTILISLEVQT